MHIWFILSVDDPSVHAEVLVSFAETPELMKICVSAVRHIAVSSLMKKVVVIINTRLCLLIMPLLDYNLITIILHSYSSSQCVLLHKAWKLVWAAQRQETRTQKQRRKEKKEHVRLNDNIIVVLRLMEIVGVWNFWWICPLRVRPSPIPFSTSHPLQTEYSILHRCREEGKKRGMRRERAYMGMFKDSAEYSSEKICDVFTIRDSVGHHRPTREKVCIDKQTERKTTFFFYPQKPRGFLKENKHIRAPSAVIEASRLKYASTTNLIIFSVLEVCLGVWGFIKILLSCALKILLWMPRFTVLCHQCTKLAFTIVVSWCSERNSGQ